MLLQPELRDRRAELLNINVRSGWAISASLICGPCKSDSVTLSHRRQYRGAPLHLLVSLVLAIYLER